MSLQRPLPRALNRILLNVLLDGILAAVATPLARFLADPAGGLLHPLWFVGGGAITLLVAGLPFRMPQQYWRFSGIEDLLGVVGGSVASAILFALLLLAAGFPLPTPTFPVDPRADLIVALGTPRVVYRLRRGRSRAAGRQAQIGAAGRGGRECRRFPARARHAGGAGEFPRARPAERGRRQRRAADSRADHPGLARPGRRRAGAVAAGGAAGVGRRA